MSQSSSEASPSVNYKSIFDGALHAYKTKTGKDLSSDPLFHRLETCSSPDDIITILRQQIPGPDQSASGSSDGRLTRWLDPTVKVINAFSETIGGTITLAYPPGGVIFTGIGILLSAVNAVSASRTALFDLFERIENVFKRLEIYTGAPLTAGMTDAIVKVMVEVLGILALLTKEIRQSRAKKFVKQLVGKTDVEDALQRLEKVTVEEARIAAAEALKAIHGVGNKVEDGVQGIHDAVKAVENRVRNVEGMIQGVGDMLHGVDERVKGIGDKVIIGRQMTDDLDDIDAMAAERLKSASDIARSADDVQGPIREIKAGSVDAAGKIYQPTTNEYGDPSLKRLRNAAVEWISPPDPFMNYSSARETRHKGTTMWFIESSTYKYWKTSGSLFWIHGKPGSGKSVITSAIVEDIERISKTGTAHVAYFFFDFKDTGKQDARAFLSSILVQLSKQSATFFNILLDFYSAHQHGSQQPGDRGLILCLEEMLKVTREEQIYIIIDALDECPDTSGLQSSREKVLELVEELIRFQLPNLRLCVTSRPEIDIRNVLEPLTSTSNRVSLQDQDGQKKDIADYVRSVVYADRKMMRWREKDKFLVIKTLSDRADGMFRWVWCQIEAIRRCLAPSVRRVLEELPQTLDETYERILREIPKANQAHSHRLLQCLTVAVRPLRVEELAEVLAVEINPTEGIAKLNEDLRWEDQEQAVLSACSSLIAVVDFHGSRVVQFSHFSVREFLTSYRLATSTVDTSLLHHIRLEPAHTVMAQACLGALLSLEFPLDKERMRKFPLADYAAKHFADHAEFGNVISHITGEVDYLLDADRPHYAAWISHISSSWWAERGSGRPKASPLHHVAELGFYGLAQHLISKRPQDVMALGGVHGTPVHAALRRRHFKVFQLLLSQSVGMDIRDYNRQTPLHVAITDTLVEGTRIIQLLLEYGADLEAQNDDQNTPLHQAAQDGKLDAAQALLKHHANVRARNNHFWTPLHQASFHGYPEIIQLLLEHSADPEALDVSQETPLHKATQQGKFTSVKALLKHHASVRARNDHNWTPLHHASWHGYPDIIQVLLEHGADLEARNVDQDTPLHRAVWQGKLAAVQMLLKHGASVHARNDHYWTPLHHASYYGYPEIIQLLLEHGADLEVQNVSQDTPLNNATQQGKFTAVKALLERHASVRSRNDHYWTPLHQASFYGYPTIVQLLLEHGANVESQNVDQDTSLILAAQQGKLAVVQVLLEHHASVHARNNHYWMPLHQAAFYGYPSIVKLLLEHDANLEAQNVDQDTPLHLAARQGKLAVVQELLKHHASVHARNNNSWTPLHHASFYGYSDIIQVLVEHGADLEARNVDQNTSLHLAAWEGKLAAAQQLLERGAIVHARNNTGRTPLHHASFCGYSNITQLLLEYRAEADTQDAEGATPLHLAVANGKMEVVRLLLKSGASLQCRNKNLQTPFQIASGTGSQEIRELLREHMSRE